jgi:thiosulfate/3-mercaptopyruvate sulfurtransferase
MAAAHAHSDVLVDTTWLGDRLHDPAVMVAEVSEDAAAYQRGHIPGAVLLDCRRHLRDRFRHDWIARDRFERLLGAYGVGDASTLVLYGDGHNRLAACAFWLCKTYGVDRVCLLDGGREAWIAEGRPVAADTTSYPRAAFRAKNPDLSIRAFRGQVLERLGAPGTVLVDVRTSDEYRGSPEPEQSHAGGEAIRLTGHIPGALNVPWTENIRENGTLNDAADLRAMYERSGVYPDHEVIVYGRTGEQSSFTWMVLRCLLGYPRVRNYDGSWLEWGNLVGAPAEQGVARGLDRPNGGANGRTE